MDMRFSPVLKVWKEADQFFSHVNMENVLAESRILLKHSPVYLLG